jgi:hypothetical protein
MLFVLLALSMRTYNRNVSQRPWAHGHTPAGHARAVITTVVQQHAQRPA